MVRVLTRATHPILLDGVIASGVNKMAKRKQQSSTVDSWRNVPQFATEAEEVAWWSTHEPGKRLLKQMKPVPLNPEEQTARGTRTHPVAIRFDDSTLERVRALAHRRHKGYQTLLKEFVVERLYEEEKREGMVG
jgi:CopG antitoxin of type II toxin-antitoxin system